MTDISRPAIRRHPLFLALVLWSGLLAAAVRSHADPYARIEASFNIASLATDPFDYTVTDVQVQILQPDSTTRSLPAFFDGGTTWRVRHTPMQPGTYQITGITLNGSPASVSNLQPTSWTVTGDPISPGYVRIDPAQTNRFITSNGRRYFPVGEDIAWDQGSATVVGSLGKMGPTHGNWARIWMDYWDGKNLDWPSSGPNPPLGQLILSVAAKWDSIVTAAEQNGIAFQMTLHHHGEYSSTVDPNWPQNPYNVANGGFLTNAAQFFTDPTAKALTKRKLRYIVARWGYSPSIMGWELFNEVQFTDAGQAGQWTIIGAWHDEMADFLRSQDSYQHLITTSSDVTQPIWNKCDYYQHHDYPIDYISALRDPQDVPAGQPIKPIFGGEAGRSNVVYYGQHAPLWAGLMAGQSGIAQPWYWDQMDSERCYNLVRPVRDFILSAGIADQIALNKSAPLVSGVSSGPLQFGLGGGWATAVQDTFTVGLSAPAGVGTAPSYLQGNYHRAMTPNGFTFLVDYPLAGTFSVQIITIAQSGAGFEMFLDGVVQTNISFPASTGDVSTNLNITIPVSAGSHTIKLYNPSTTDWVQLGNITLNPYVPLLGAYQIGNSNFAAMWLWHRTNIYLTTPTASLNGSVPLAGLQPGNYVGTWWDTIAGAAVSNFTFTVTDTNPVVLSTPSVLRSLALFAGLPPQAGLTAPALTHTMGTNSPALTLPLTLANNGGLPLSYSLAITGASPVSYTALNSVQPGGPIYNWRDISGVGQDITSSFVALAAPKVSRDEGIAGPFNLGFNFPFFSGGQAVGTFKQVYVSPNGFITFSPFAGDTSLNRTLPGLLAPTNLIALLWDDLDLSAGSGHAYVDSDPVNGTFTVQFQNVNFKSSGSTATCEVILKSTGEILLQYASVGIPNACTVGLQDAAGDQGLQVAFNQSYVGNNFAVRLTPAAWLKLNANAGLVPKASADVINTSINPAGLGYGTYTATVVMKTGDPLQSLFTFPVELDITPIGTWRQSKFASSENAGNAADNADPDGDGLINILEYAFNTDPNVPNPSPVSFAVVNDHLTLTFKRTHPAPSDITYWFEVTDDLASGVWQSGPVFTTQNVTDNLDGTETVVVTDNAAVSATATHFLRIRVSSP
jgi:hypothetical protein